jgi:hypothetical protein
MVMIVTITIVTKITTIFEVLMVVMWDVTPCSMVEM